MAGDRESRTEKPTPKRMRKARQEGQIPKSMELVAWTSMLITVFLLQITVKLAGTQFRPLLQRTGDVMAKAETGPALSLLGQWAVAGLIVVAPLLLGTMVVGVVMNVAQVGFAPSVKLLAPKFSRVSPTKGLKRLLSTTTLWETAKALLKVTVLSLVTYRAVMGIVPVLVDGGHLSAMTTVGIVAARAMSMLRTVALVGLGLAAADYAFQRRKIQGQLRMTKQELKEEARESEGDPHMKQAIRSKQLAMSRNRMMASVAGASVVVVNPTHVSVALRYEATEGPPRVVAKGADLVAARIREEAMKHGVPIVEDVPLARTIFRACELNDVIPAELYDAVARVLAFIFGLRRRGALGDGVQRMAQSTLAEVG
ncbi:MAG: Flagellar biosynthesis protein FlhB [Acidimicrobiales bacterium]|jgi:flagellar biosynthetic protein FlhB|nr:Flagellar biosynthesis protein FlhB [Acidimicrobiales bacterium]